MAAVVSSCNGQKTGIFQPVLLDRHVWKIKYQSKGTQTHFVRQQDLRMETLRLGPDGPPVNGTL